MQTLQNTKFLTTKDVAKLLHVNEKMVYSLVNEKGLPATKITGKWLFPRRLVDLRQNFEILGIIPYAGIRRIACA